MKIVVSISFVIEDINDSPFTVPKLKHYFKGWLPQWLRGLKYYGLNVTTVEVQE